MTTPFRPTIRTQADLEEVWRHLMTPLGFTRSSLWLLLIGSDDHPLAQVTEVADVPEVLDVGTTAGLAAMLTGVIRDHDPAGRWALLLSRPGRHGLDDRDRTRVAALYAMCREHGIAHEVAHLATDDAVVPVPLDEVAGYLRAS